MCRHHHAVARRLQRFEFLEKLQAVLGSQVNVEQGKLEGSFIEQRLGFLAAVGNAAPVTLGGQHRIQPPANRLVIVNYQNLQLLPHRALRDLVKRY
jgi:hypothetical protein